MENLLFVGVAQAIFTTVFLASRRSCPFSDRILAVWMVFIALPMIGGTAILLWPDVSLPILSADLIYPLTYGPFMWLYVRTLTGGGDRLTHRDLLHFLPFFLISMVQLVTGWAPPPPNPEFSNFDTSTRFIGALNLVSMLSYSGAVARRLRQHGKEVVQHFSSLSNRVTLTWLYWLTAGFSAVSLLLFLASVLSLPDLLRIHLPAQLVIIMALSFFGLRQVQIFDHQQGFGGQGFGGQDFNGQGLAGQGKITHPNTELSQQGRFEHPNQPPKPDDTKIPYSRSGLTNERAAQISEKLDAFMTTERPYLSADLTIANLAKQMAVPRHHLTEVINTRHHKSFYQFVNEYRIEAVKQAMHSPENGDQTLLDLAYAHGFNSKSPFNAAFKQLTGMTPSQYRRQLA